MRALRHVQRISTAIGEQHAVRQPGQGIKVRQLPDAALGHQLLGCLGFQCLDGAAQFERARLHQVLKFRARMHQRGFCRLARADVLRNPDRALLGVGYIHQLGVHLAPDGLTILLAQHHLAFKGLAGSERACEAASDFTPVFVRQIPSPR